MVDFISLINDFGLLGLFLTTFLSASIVPFPSEPAIVLTATVFNPVSVFVISLIGYVLGGMTNYYIGLKGLHNFLVKRSPENEKKAQKVFKKWGVVTLIIAPWIPFIGDPLLIVAGILRMNFRKFFIVTAIAKTIKILALIWLGGLLTPLLYSF